MVKRGEAVERCFIPHVEGTEKTRDRADPCRPRGSGKAKVEVRQGVAFQASGIVKGKRGYGQEELLACSGIPDLLLPLNDGGLQEWRKV